MEEFKKTIDIEAIIRGKNPRLYRLLPGFILHYIKRKIHEDEVNDCMWVNRHKFGFEFNKACLDYVGAKVEWSGLENIPETGGVIIASNHPMGGLDGMAIIHAVSQRRKDARFIVNDILTNMKNFGDVFVGVNKVGASAADTIRLVDAVYQSEGATVIFPAGLVSRKQKGVIKDLEWKKSFVSKALQYNKPIVPVFITGQNTKFFYNFALWRKRLGIKANIEMFFLVDEMLKQRSHTLKIIVGKAIYPQDLDKSKSHLQLAQDIRELVYALGKDV